MLIIYHVVFLHTDQDNLLVVDPRFFEHSTTSVMKFDFDILSPNTQNQTILHLCIQSNMFELFNMICNSKHVDSAEIFDILNNFNATPLTKIFDEDFLKTVLSDHSERKFCRETLKVVLWHICKNNFNQAFHRIKESMPQDEFLRIIMLKDDDWNNSSMIAAKEASDMVLMSLLSSLVYSIDDMDTKHEYLHHKNKSGDTLLKIIISHGDTLSMHREVMIKVCFIYTSYSSLSSIYVCFHEFSHSTHNLSHAEKRTIVVKS